MMTPSVFHSANRPRFGASHRALLPAAIVLLWFCEPALANKFETIGGGVSGSSQLKLEWLQGFLYIVGGISLASSLLAVVVPHDNPLYLNYGNWKKSAVVFAIVGLLFIGAGLLIGSP